MYSTIMPYRKDEVYPDVHCKVINLEKDTISPCCRMGISGPGHFKENYSHNVHNHQGQAPIFLELDTTHHLSGNIDWLAKDRRLLLASLRDLAFKVLLLAVPFSWILR